MPVLICARFHRVDRDLQKYSYLQSLYTYEKESCQIFFSTVGKTTFSISKVFIAYIREFSLFFMKLYVARSY